MQVDTGRIFNWALQDHCKSSGDVNHIIQWEILIKIKKTADNKKGWGEYLSFAQDI